MQTPRIEDALNDFAVLRTTFETLNSLPRTDPICEEMEAISWDARKSLIFRIESLCVVEKETYATYPLTDVQIHSCALEMIARGCLTQNLNAMMKLKVFDETEPRYFYKLTGFEEMTLARWMPSDLFVRLMLLELLGLILDEDNYVDLKTFDTKVFQKFIAVLFIFNASSDPIFYGIQRSDS